MLNWGVNSNMDDTNEIRQENRKIFYFIFVALILIAGFVFKFYDDQKKENSALKIKIMTLNRSRAITPWQRTLTPNPNTQKVQKKLPDNNPKNIQDKVSATSSSTVNSESFPLPAEDEEPLQNIPTDELANTLNNRMIAVKSQDAAALNENMEIADEIISREPGSYSAYKAKLISLLVKEGKLKQPVDDNEVNALLETMASFDVSADPQTKKEAALISNNSNLITATAERLDQVSAARTQIENLLELTPPDSIEGQSLLIEHHNLVATEQQMSNRLEELNNNAGTQTANLNDDVVQIPFLRMMAKNDLDGVIENASAFIEQFPESPEGYFFLVKALEESGQKDEALRVIQESKLGPEAQNTLQSRLLNAEDLAPEDYWSQLSF